MMNETRPNLDATAAGFLLPELPPEVDARWRPRTTVLIQVLFWAWHAVWLFGVVGGMGPIVLPALLVDTLTGGVPWDLTLSAIALTLLPVATAIAGWRFRGDAIRLLRLFYGVGGVAGTLLLVRLFLIRQTTPAVDLLLATLAFGVAFYAAELFGGLTKRTLAVASARVLGGSALLIIGLYVGATAGLYSIPGAILTLVGILETLGRALEHGSFTSLLGASFFLVVLGVFVLFTFTLLLGLPLAVAILYSRAWWRSMTAWRVDRPLWQALTMSGACVAAWVVALAALNVQPQQAAFARLMNPPRDLPQQRDNAAHADEIRDGLLNAYLSPHRYWGTREGSEQLGHLYKRAFVLGRDAAAPQALFDVLAAPFLYDGTDMLEDRQRAADQYARFFDRTLQQAEQAAVLEALSATHDRTEAEAGLLDVGQRKVARIRQSLSTRVDGDVARLSLRETYENQTHELQEIVYEFSVPEHVAFTGLTLEDDSGFRFTHVVAPRGAAQSVYRQQRDRRADPALLEQVGPRQYRLRVYPIPAAPGLGKADPIHLTLEWTALSDGRGWSLPQLARARNVYADEDCEARIDGVPSAHAGWLPARIDAPAPQRPHRVALGGYAVLATPARADPSGPRGPWAVVLETSASMRPHAAAVQRVLSQLRDAGGDVELYLAPSPYGAQEPRALPWSETAALDYYGGHTLDGVLTQFDALSRDKSYSAVLVISDSEAAALDSDVTAAAAAPVAGDPPLWILHLGGLPPGYTDSVGDRLVRTHGGVATTLDEFLARVGGPVVDGYAMQFPPIDGEPREPTPDDRDPFAPIAARALIKHLATRMVTGGSAELDAMHAVAVKASVVTPWSSMLVLVDDAQRAALLRAQAAEERFERITEDGVEDTTTPIAALQLAATPEPEEWALLVLVVGGLLLRIGAMRRPAQPATC